jgi:small multidrug resistance pump
MSWIYLGAAILLEVAGITSMKLSRGFSELVPSLAVLVFYLFSAIAVILALKRLDLSTTYAIWSGVGTALAAMIGVAYFREPLTTLKIVSLLLVIIGVIGLSLPAKPTDSSLARPDDARHPLDAVHGKDEVRVVRVERRKLTSSRCA